MAWCLRPSFLGEEKGGGWFGNEVGVLRGMLSLRLAVALKWKFWGGGRSEKDR